MTLKETEPKDTYMKINRFCGEELYPIQSATWHIWESDDEDEVNELWLEINAGEGIQLSEDTKSLNAEPSWELTYECEALSKKNLIPGFHAEFDDDDDDEFTNFYYCEHASSNKNTIDVLAVEGERLLIRVTGEVTDVNYYDGSKPCNKVEVETWFEPRH